MKTFRLTVLSAERTFFDGDAVSVMIPTPEGYYGVMAHHSNTVSATVPGELRYTVTEGGEQKRAAISAGLFKVEDNTVLILTETAEHPDEIDAKRAEREAEEAKEEMLRRRSVKEYNLAQAKLARALNRLKVKNKPVN